MHRRALLTNTVVTRWNRSRMPAGWPLCANVGDPIYIGESNRQGFIPFKARRPLNARHCASNLPPDGSPPERETLCQQFAPGRLALD
jgi:hypothetical protein